MSKIGQKFKLAAAQLLNVAENTQRATVLPSHLNGLHSANFIVCASVQYASL